MLKQIFLTKNVKFNLSNFLEFHQDHESAGLILFGENWIFAYFVTLQPAVKLQSWQKSNFHQIE